ncbi:cysteine-rich with EGF-like domain protein 2-B [Parasteatoda tepidariorum]|uniref:cysteine-rich with EGF-like domain protein 2-B n=1 Tax=Parasteatoda tepidariorum TaxID=114398 RepID=UPI0039BD460A
MCDDKHACANGARCLQDICVCLTGTGGPYCETIYECENKLCGDDVTCQYDSRTQRAYCQCKAAQQTYDSDDKSCKKCSCGDDLKTEWERCDFVLGKKVCQCTEGYAYSPKADKCLECDCGNNSKTCTFEDKGEKVCQCFKGYIDDFGTCKKCECGSNGECSFDSNGNFSKCLCDSGFSENSGKCVLCDCGPKSKCSFQNKRKMCLCAKGYKDDEGYCTDIDECLNTEACPGPGTLCENTFGSYKCRCQQGYQGRSPTETDKKSLCEKIVESGPNYTPWKIGYGLLSVGFIIIIACLAYVIFRMHKNLKISNSSIPLRNRNPL